MLFRPLVSWTKVGDIWASFVLGISNSGGRIMPAVLKERKKKTLSFVDRTEWGLRLFTIGYQGYNGGAGGAPVVALVFSFIYLFNSDMAWPEEGLKQSTGICMRKKQYFFAVAINSAALCSTNRTKTICSFIRFRLSDAGSRRPSMQSAILYVVDDHLLSEQIINVRRFDLYFCCPLYYHPSV